MHESLFLRFFAASGSLIRALTYGAGSLAIVTCGAGPAHASVVTSVLVSTGESSYYMGYSYNHGTTGTATSDACTGRGDCSATGSGTVDSTGLLTASNDQVTLSATLGPNFFNETSPTTGAASARASLLTGTIGVLATGTFSDFFHSGGQDGAYARGFASISDGLHFTVAGANSGTVTDIGVTFAVHGAITTDAQFGPYESFGSGLSFGPASFHSSVSSNLVNGRPPPFNFSDAASNWVSYGYSVNTANDIVFTGIYALTGATSDLGITETLDASCGDGFNCDFSHTGAVSFSLPDGVTFTSDSGVFLTSSDLPEPGSLLLLSTGLGLGALLRRRRSKV